MQTDKTSNASNTAATPPNAPAPAGTEADFLQQQAEQAKAAMAAMWSKVKGELGNGVDPRQWTKEYPWISVAAAAVAGFVAGSAIVPSKEDQALKKLAKIERALAPEHQHQVTVDGNGKDVKIEKRSFLGTMMKEVLALLKPALMSAITAGITARKTAEQTHEAAAEAATETAQNTPPDSST
ncbi:MAG TPA: hypothetical protein VIL86_18475 [Tepidisphaeraceae bacterium]|jgi:hypothetical protein